MDESHLGADAGGSSMATLGDGDAPSASTSEGRLVCGDAVGRYRITGVLGHGGMGVVYAAYDPELDRKLAIKVLHPHARGSLGGTLGQQRMLREARAMARLTHPNVVTVHDVGPFERSVFVAMELIEGKTVTAWTATPRRWQDALAVFVAAGEGLVAAHRVGLVHRDFKPDNIMIAADPERPDAIGRVVVMDFGLARSADDLDEQAVQTGVGSHDARLTLTGAVLGTPAYMAPEQHRSSTTTALSDQFAFCIALHEALWGMRPFEGDNIGALALAVSRGVRNEPADLRGVPARIMRVLARGLAVEPQQRWPSMRALLDALAHDPARSRRTWFAVAALPVVVAGGVFGLDRWRTPDPESDTALCVGGRERVAEVWNDGRRDTLRQAFAASTRGNADETRVRLEAQLDGFADAFEVEYQRACAATNIEKVQSAALMDRRMSCLSRRVVEVDALLGQLDHVEDRLLDRAVSAMGRATDLAPCRDVDAVARDAELPTEADAMHRVEGMQRELAIARAQKLAGKAKDALATLDGVLVSLDQQDVPAFRASVLFLRAQVLAALGDPIASEAAMLDAHWTARRSGNDRVAAQTAAEMMVTVSESRPAEVAVWEQQARAEVERLGDEGELRARLLDDLAQVAMHRRDLDTAYELHAQAMTLWEELTGRDSLDVAVAEHGMGNVEFLRRNDAAARGHYGHAIEIWRTQLGEHHPQLTDGYIMLGNLAHRAGDLDEAERQFELALQLGEVVYGPEHIELLPAINGLGLVYGSRDEHQRSLDIHERALRATRAAYGPDHPQVATMDSNCADELAALGRHEEALERHRGVLALRERVLTPGHAVIAETLDDVATELIALGRPDEAEPLLRRALAIAEADGGSAESTAGLREALAALHPPRNGKSPRR